MDPIVAAKLATDIAHDVHRGAQAGVLDLRAIAQMLCEAELWPNAAPWPLATVCAHLHALGPSFVQAQALYIAGAADDTWAHPPQACVLEAPGGQADVVGIAYALATVWVLCDRAHALWDHHPSTQTMAPKAYDATLWPEVLQVAPDAWAQAMAATDNALALMLTQPFTPTVHLSPVFKPAHPVLVGRQAGRKVLGFLAQMGLAQRPWHLWVGPQAPIALISPYVRDLGPRLLSWRSTHRHLLGEALATALDAIPCGADSAQHAALRYGVAEAFVAQDEGLAQERQAAERTVGIVYGHLDPTPFTVIDLGRAQPHLWDVRLPKINPHAVPSEKGAPILICLPYTSGQTCEQALAALIARLVQSLGGTAQSVTVCQPGLMADPAQHAVIAQSMLTAAGHYPLLVDAPSLTPWPAALGGLAPATLDVLPCPLADAWAWAWATATPHDEETLPAAATVGGGGHLAATLLRLRARGALPHALSLVWGVYDAWAPWQGQDAIAYAWLNHILTPKAPEAPANKPSGAKKSVGLRV